MAFVLAGGVAAIVISLYVESCVHRFASKKVAASRYIWDDAVVYALHRPLQGIIGVSWLLIHPILCAQSTSIYRIRQQKYFQL